MVFFCVFFAQLWPVRGSWEHWRDTDPMLITSCTSCFVDRLLSLSSDDMRDSAAKGHSGPWGCVSVLIDLKRCILKLPYAHAAKNMSAPETCGLINQIVIMSYPSHHFPQQVAVVVRDWNQPFLHCLWVIRSCSHDSICDQVFNIYLIVVWKVQNFLVKWTNSILPRLEQHWTVFHAYTNYFHSAWDKRPIWPNLSVNKIMKTNYQKQFWGIFWHNLVLNIMSSRAVNLNV